MTKMMVIIMEASAALGLTVLEKTTEKMHMPDSHTVHTDAANHGSGSGVYSNKKFVHLGGTVTENARIDI